MPDVDEPDDEETFEEGEAHPEPVLEALPNDASEADVLEQAAAVPEDGDGYDEP